MAAAQAQVVEGNTAPARDTKNQRSPELVVLSRERAESYEPRGNEICISISDPTAPPARVSPQFASVLRLYFDDVIERGEPSDVLFATEHARAIKGFLEQWPDVDRIVVHCNMGVSRSPGVALGLCDLRGWATAELERAHPAWNRLVRGVMRQVADETS
ncbi:MAG: hypothetical protein ACJ78G_13855 [Gemmatimonadaceae bacterium]